jgi:hypothetical protein
MSRSLQEDLVRKLSGHVLGDHALFFPDLIGPNGNEPADLAWVVNRCAILMYMTAGKKDFIKKREHNLGQLRRWLRVWERGMLLTGTSGGVRHSFRRTDIDHVIGLSVVDGGELWCEFHPDQVKLFRESLTLCATVTGNVLRELSFAIAGPRDVIHVLRKLIATQGNRVSEREMISWIRRDQLAMINSVRNFFNLGTTPNRYFREALTDIPALFLSLRHSTKFNHAAYEVVADLRLSDIAWFAAAEATLGPLIAGPGELGPLALKTETTVDMYFYRCVSAAHSGDLANYMDRLLRSVILPGITILTMYDQGKRAPTRLLDIRPRRSTRSMLQRELDVLKAK